MSAHAPATDGPPLPPVPLTPPLPASPDGGIAPRSPAPLPTEPPWPAAGSGEPPPVAIRPRCTSSPQDAVAISKPTTTNNLAPDTPPPFEPDPQFVQQRVYQRRPRQAIGRTVVVAWPARNPPAGARYTPPGHAEAGVSLDIRCAPVTATNANDFKSARPLCNRCCRKGDPSAPKIGRRREFQHCGKRRFFGKNRVDSVGKRRTFGAFHPLVRGEGPMSLRRSFTMVLVMVALPSLATRALARRPNAVGPADDAQVRDLLAKLA